MARTRRWLALREAAALLGVDQATLRHWADLGKVQTFRTPGGHRRFLEEDIRSLMVPVPTDRGDLAAALRRRTLRLVTGLPAKRLRAAPWFSRLDEPFRAEAREHGRRVVDLLAQAVSGSVERHEAVKRMRAFGREYGQALRQAELSVAQATEAFGFFRDLVLARSAQAAPSGEEQVRVLREVSRLLDMMLLALVQSYEPAAEGSA